MCVYRGAVTGDVLATVKAHDLDSDDNAKITYELREDHQQTELRPSLLHLDPHSGQLSLTHDIEQLQSRDDDVSRVYHVYVTATDHGTPPRSSTASLKVIVGQPAKHGVMTSRVGVSVYVTSAVFVGVFLLAMLLLCVAVLRRRRRRRHGNHHHHHHQLSGSHESAHILPSCTAVDKSSVRPLRDLERPDLDLEHFPARRLQVYHSSLYTLFYH